MLRWTTSHQIPVDFEADKNHRTRINSTVINNNVWLVFSYFDRRELKYKHQMAVFDTTSLEAIKVDCEIPDFGGYGVSNNASQLDQMYILTVNAVNDFKLHQFDTKTMTFSDFVSINVRLIGKLQILENHMYSLARTADSEKLLLITIDLFDKTVESKTLVENPEDSYYQIFTNNETLYLFEHSRGMRQVYVIDKDNKTQLLKLANADISFPGVMKWVNDSVITQTFKPMGSYPLETIDFDKKEWLTALIEKHKTPSAYCVLKSAKCLDNKIYAVFQTTFYRQKLKNMIEWRSPPKNE